MSDLPDYNKISFPTKAAIPFKEILPDASEQAIDLLEKFLQYPAKKRISAKQVREHGYQKS
jgi:cell cycle related kinase